MSTWLGVSLGLAVKISTAMERTAADPSIQAEKTIEAYNEVSYRPHRLVKLTQLVGPNPGHRRPDGDAELYRQNSLDWDVSRWSFGALSYRTLCRHCAIAKPLLGFTGGSGRYIKHGSSF